jgi:hypothetical protein
MSTSISLLNNDNSFTALDNGSAGKVAVYWNGKSVTDESLPGAQPATGGDFPYGPVPFVDISRTYNNENGNISHITTNITIAGKVLSLKPGVVFDDVIKKSKKLEQLFKNCLFGSFAIMCGTSVAFSGDNFYIKQIDFNKTGNNWTRFLDYNISLESKAPVSGNLIPNSNDDYARYVEARSDVWTIEPLQDYVFSKFNDPINAAILAGENNGPGGQNTKVKPPPGGAAVGGGAVGGGISIDFLSLPQFKITRKLSAKGLPVSGKLPVACSDDGLDQINRIRFLNAKAWVNKESHKVIGDANVANHSGSMRIGEVYPFAATGTWFYNHIRTINADIYNGTYEVNDSWLAMPTGIGYTESYTLDASTSANGIRTVRVAGSVQGLHIHKVNQTDKNHAVITGIPDPHIAAVPELKVNISGAVDNTEQMTRGQSNKLPSAISQTSDVANIEKNKYANAASGWFIEVKPYLYRRACIANQRSATPQFDINRFKPLAIIPISLSEGHDPHKGIITYSYEYNNKYRAISGVISENINIIDDAPVNNIIETPVMGRELGPIIQSLGATNPRRTLSIDLVVQTPTGINSTLRTHNSCPLYISGTIYGAVQALVNGNKPFDMRTGPIWTNFNRASPIQGNVFTQSDSESWEPTQGRYSRTVTWIYKQCDPATNFMDT